MTESWTEVVQHTNVSQVIDKSFDVSEQVLWTVIDVIIMFPIVGGNVLTICAIVLCRRLSNVISNQFILNLAISDLLVGFFLPYHIAFSLYVELSNNEMTCLLRFMLVILPCCASIYNLIAVAVDRYICIVHPLHYSAYMTKRKASIIVTVGWIMAFVLSSAPIYWNHYATARYCILEQVFPPMYVSCVITPAFVLVWVVMFSLYWRIWKEASTQARRIRNTIGGHPDWKSAQVVLLILGSFSICWLPYFTIICVRVNGSRSYESFKIYKIAFSMGMTNSFINPLIYAWKNTEFKSAFKNILQCKSPNRMEQLLENNEMRVEMHTIDSSLRDPV